MTKEEKLANLDKAEKKLHKLEAKGYKLIAEVQAASDYHGTFSEDRMPEYLERFIKWMQDDINTKRKWVHKYGQ